MSSFEARSQEELLRLGVGRTGNINPIKLKAMAMKLRHHVQGYSFHRQTSQQHAPLHCEQPSLSASEQLELRLPEPLQALPLQPQENSRSSRIGVEHSLEDPLLGTSVARNSTERRRPSAETSIVAVDGPDNLLGLKTILFHPMCLLLVCVPLGVASRPLGWSDSWTFWLNFLALVPLAKILGDATEELASSIGNDTISGLLNATFGNAVEMIVAVQSLRADLLMVVKTSLLGSVLSNILLVLGTAFLLGGLTSSKKQRGRFYSFNNGDSVFRERFIGLEKEQKFPVKGALISLAMLLFSCMSFALPTIFDLFPSDDSESVLQVSRIGAWIVMSSYVAFLIFQLVTHRKTLTKEEKEFTSSSPRPFTEDSEDDVEAKEDSDDEVASLTWWFALILMAACTVVVSVNSELLVDAIEPVVRSYGIPYNFIGIILLPIAGNACEHAAAIRFAVQDRPGLAIGIAVGSSTQVALLVVPLSVIAGWYLDKPMDLSFGALHTAVVTLSVLVVLTLLLDGRSNWLKGYILVCLYVFIAVLYWYVPTQHLSNASFEL